MAESQARVRRAQRLLDVVGRGGAREDEPQIARALGQRHQQLIGLRRDADVGRRPATRGLLEAVDTDGTRRAAESESSSRPRRDVRASSRSAVRPSACRNSSSSSGDRFRRARRTSARNAARGRTGRRSAAPPLRARTRPPRSRGTRRESVRAPGRSRRGRAFGRIDDRRLVGVRRRVTASRRWFPRRTGRRVDPACRRSRARIAPWRSISPSTANSRPGMNAFDEHELVRGVALGPDVRRCAAARAAVRTPSRGQRHRRRASRRGCPTARPASGRREAVELRSESRMRIHRLGTT